MDSENLEDHNLKDIEKFAIKKGLNKKRKLKK